MSESALMRERGLSPVVAFMYVKNVRVCKHVFCIILFVHELERFLVFT